ncbi:DAB2IP [Cordylochernes scorpioides]|uniref:DAB2IP n=1 Tax=Cordylochernes scorpioides TaxID=51811 RepID=A0ABY6LQ21_9ARAC|nr:DAB2IP [Cordylochernes scorpioides]
MAQAISNFQLHEVFLLQVCLCIYRFFCEIYLDKTLYAKTSSRQKAEMCFWGEQFEFDHLPAFEHVNIYIYREADKKKRKEKNVLIGKYHISYIILFFTYTFNRKILSRNS